MGMCVSLKLTHKDAKYQAPIKGKVGILGGKSNGEEEYGWSFGYYLILFQKLLTMGRVGLTSG